MQHLPGLGCGERQFRPTKLCSNPELCKNPAIKSHNRRILAYGESKDCSECRGEVRDKPKKATKTGKLRRDDNEADDVANRVRNTTIKDRKSNKEGSDRHASQRESKKSTQPNDSGARAYGSRADPSSKASRVTGQSSSSCHDAPAPHQSASCYGDHVPLAKASSRHADPYDDRYPPSQSSRHHSRRAESQVSSHQNGRCAQDQDFSDHDDFYAPSQASRYKKHDPPSRDASRSQERHRGRSRTPAHNPMRVDSGYSSYATSEVGDGDGGYAGGRFENNYRNERDDEDDDSDNNDFDPAQEQNYRYASANDSDD